MLKIVGTKPALLVMQQAFGLLPESIKDENAFLENIYRLLEKIREKEKQNRFSHVFSQIRDMLQGRLDNKDRIKCYEEILDILIGRIPLGFVKYIIDSNWIEENRKQYLEISSLRGTRWEHIFEIVKAYYTDISSDRFEKYQKSMLAVLKSYCNEVKAVNTILERLNNGEFQQQYVDALLSCEGFFDIKEFSFLLSKESIYSQLLSENNRLFLREERVVHEGRTDIRDIGFYYGIEELYKRVHELLIKEIRKKYPVTNGKLSLQLCHMNESDRKLLQKCLQVTADGSLTGMISSVRIQDMISNEYAMVMREIGIQKIRMIDTYGLDHVDIRSKAMLKDNLYDNIYRYEKDEGVKFKDISVVYVKKLDSGKPDELRTVIPCVREVLPTAPLYCVFSGIDIFYRTPEEIKSICWKKADDEKVPKAVRYILSEKGKQELQLPMASKEDHTEENMYLVLKNNLIPYCGKKTLVRNNFYYYENNVKNIHKLLASIAMKEYSSLEIVDISPIKEQKEEVIRRTEGIIKAIFEEASLQAYHFRYNTMNADIRSFKKYAMMGYSGTYRHQLNQLFHEAYSKVIAREGISLAELFEPSEAALKAALKNMEDKFLGDGENLWKVKPSKGKNRFRITLEKMYENYEYNPFKNSFTEEDLGEKQKRNAIFNDIFNFSKGLEDKEILNAFAKAFVECMEEQIVEDNKTKSYYLVKMDESFTDSLIKLKNEFMEKYATGSPEENQLDCQDAAATEKFKRMMQYYFSNDIV